MSGFVGDQTCNAAGRAIIEASESFRALPYLCPNGIPTQGYGHTLGITMQSPCITQAQADIWLEEDLAIAENDINNRVSYELTSNEFSALCSLVFNIGVGNFRRSSLLIVINNGDLLDVPEHIHMWTHDKHGNVLNGLVTRRESEIALWELPDPQEEPDDDSSA